MFKNSCIVENRGRKNIRAGRQVGMLQNNVFQDI